MSIEFGVQAVPQPATPDGFTVVGRVLAGAVRVGDVFTEAVAEEVRPVSLRVVEVRRYEDVLVDEVESTFSALLLLTGSGGDALTTGVTLRHRV